MDLYDSMLASGAASRLQRARVRAVPAQHSWAALPGPLVSKLLDSQAPTPLVLKLTPAAASLAAQQQQTSRSSPFANSSSSTRQPPAALASTRPRYVAWAGAVSSAPGVLELPAHLAAALQLPSGTEVVLQVLSQPPLAPAAAVVVEPVGPADWEVVELNAGLLEEHVLGQAGVVVLGQPLVVWARQAKVTLKVTQIIHHTDSSAASAAAAAAAGGGGRPRQHHHQQQQLLYIKDVARLDQGTELHIAPKPRVGAAGGGLNPGLVPLGSAAAAAAGAGGGGGGDADSHQQQGQQGHQQQQVVVRRKPVWLRVCAASSRYLLPADALPGLGDGASSHAAQNNSNGSNSAASGADTAAGAAAVCSWLTVAVHISSHTARDLSLQPGELVQLHGNTTNSSSSSSRGRQSILPLQSLSVVVLVDDSVPWGHVAVTPPLQQGLSLREHQFVRLKPLHKRQQLQQLPGFLLHPLLPAGRGGVNTNSSSTTTGSSSAAAAAVGNASNVAAAAPVTGGGSSATTTGATQQPNAAAAGRQQQPQQQRQQQKQGPVFVDSFSGPGLVLETVKGLLGLPLQVVRLQTSLQQQSEQQQYEQQQPAAHSKPQQQQQQQLAAAAVANGDAAAGGGDGWLSGGLNGLIEPGVAGAAVLAWLQVQAAAAASTASAVGETGQQQGVSSDSAASHACLPICGPMLVHFRVAAGAAPQQRKQNGGQGAAAAAVAAAGFTDHLLLLVPIGEQQSAAGGGAAYLPTQLLLPSSPVAAAASAASGVAQMCPQQQQQQQQAPCVQAPAVQKAAVQVAKALTFDAAVVGMHQAAASSLVAQQHTQHVSYISTNSKQQQQHSGVGLDPSSYPWLNPALQTSVQRLKPRLNLLTWQSWQSVQLPLPGGVLLVGGSEGGRGWLLQLVGQQAAAVHGAHVLKVSCKGLAGQQSYESAAAVLAAAAAECLAHCPGLLLLDDLELLMPAPNTEGPSGLEQDQATANRLSEWLSGLMHWASKQPRPLSFCAAVSAAAALPASLRAAGCLDCEVKVPALGLTGRAALLLSGFKAKGLGFSGGLQGLEALAGKGLEGFDAKDLQLVVDRAVHAALQRHMSSTHATAAAAAAAGASSADAAAAAGDADADADADAAPGRDTESAAKPQQQQQHLLVTAEDVQQALSGFVAAAFWRAGQHKGQQNKAEGGLQGWQDVGGLFDAVSALKEALVLPAKYGHLLAAAPLRLRTGLLLFGPPGCGKTHVVAAAVAATGARLISVKGPELLNKYIGQSEAAVRELFGRAAAAAPCVLFFDEFDAIAPPRGHDSTGVTDRVVNQLLTELDGVEGLTGVAVLAATSRPDLIDAALLRPGRLDRMVYCGFPNQHDRLAILQAVSRKLVLAPDVRLQDIAVGCEGFTGADLAAILSEAQLLAVHEQIDATQQQTQEEEEGQEEEGQQGEEATTQACVLTAQHVSRALSRARPSLPATEKQRLEAVYARFQQSRDPGLSNRPAVPEQEQTRVKHATLA